MTNSFISFFTNPQSSDSSSSSSSSSESETLTTTAAAVASATSTTQHKSLTYDKYYAPLSKLPTSSLFSSCRLFLLGPASDSPNAKLCKDLIRHGGGTIFWDLNAAGETVTHLVYFPEGEGNDDYEGNDEMAMQVRFIESR